MNYVQVTYIGFVVLTIVVGQILFKMSASGVVLDQGIIQMLSSLLNWRFVSATVIYALGTVVWVVLLKSVPLSRAYPFIAVSFAVMPLIAYVLFDENINVQYLLGLLMFLAGLLIIASAE